MSIISTVIPRVNDIVSSDMSPILAFEGYTRFLPGRNRVRPNASHVPGNIIAHTRVHPSHIKYFQGRHGLTLWDCDLSDLTIRDLRASNLALYGCNLTNTTFEDCLLPDMVVEQCSWSGSKPTGYDAWTRFVAAEKAGHRVWTYNTAPTFRRCDLWLMKFQPNLMVGERRSVTGDVTTLYRGPTFEAYPTFIDCDLSGSEFDFVQSGHTDTPDWTRFKGSHRISMIAAVYKSQMLNEVAQIVRTVTKVNAFADNTPPPHYAYHTAAFIEADRLLAKLATQAARAMKPSGTDTFARVIVSTRVAVTKALRFNQFEPFSAILQYTETEDILRRRYPLSEWPCPVSQQLFALVLASQAKRALASPGTTRSSRELTAFDVSGLNSIYSLLVSAHDDPTPRYEYPIGNFGNNRFRRTVQPLGRPVTAHGLSELVPELEDLLVRRSMGPINPTPKASARPAYHVTDMAGTADEGTRTDKSAARDRIDMLLQGMTAEAAGRPMEIRNWKISAPGPFDLSNIRFVGCTFTKLDLHLCNLSGAVFVDCTFVLCRYLRASPRIVSKWLPQYDAYPWLADLVVRRKNALPDVLDELREQTRLQHKGKFPPWPTKPKMLNCDMGSTVVESTTLDDFKGSFDFKTSVLPTAYRSRDAATRQVRVNANGKWVLPRAGDRRAMHTSKAMQQD